MKIADFRIGRISLIKMKHCLAKTVPIHGGLSNKITVLLNHAI